MTWRDKTCACIKYERKVAKMILTYWLFIVSVFLPTVRFVIGERILVVHPVYAGSHILALRRIIEELTSQGHEVRVIRWQESSRIQPVNEDPRILETILAINNADGIVPFLSNEPNATFEFPDKLMWERGLNPLSVFEGGMKAVAASCRTLLSDEDLLRELERSSFKIALIDLIYNECGLALAHFLKLPVVAYWGLSFVSGETQYTTAYNSPSSIPHLYTPFTDKMNFYERLVNFVYSFGSHVVMQIHFWHLNSEIQKYLPGTPHPSTLLSNLSGVLINSHPAFDYPKQLPPSFFQIGGFHIRKPKPLPKDIKVFMEDSSDGVILFSLGKNFDPHRLPTATFTAYFEAFSSLPQKILVKSSSVPAKMPSNVMVLPYLPQSDILAHPKTVLFVTHCGLHSVMEAIHYGVKMVAVPIFFDQGNVAVRLVEKGVAVSLPKCATSSDIKEAISSVLNNGSYAEKMATLNQHYRNTLEDPLKRALWLINLVMRNDGADHLKLSARHLNMAQFFSLDVLLFLILLLFITLKFIRGIFFRRTIASRQSISKPKTS